MGRLRVSFKKLALLSAALMLEIPATATAANADDSLPSPAERHQAEIQQTLRQGHSQTWTKPNPPPATSKAHPPLGPSSRSSSNSIFIGRYPTGSAAPTATSGTQVTYPGAYTWTQMSPSASPGLRSGAFVALDPLGRI